MEYYTLSTLEFRKILTEVSKTAVEAAMIEAGLSSPIIWRVDAIKKHGRKLINRLEKHDLITKKQHYPKGNYYFEVKELNAALVVENRHRFFLRDEKA